ncbi:hypothetical protein BC938DRAFT_479191 [Jimgerdemannia flammicorona]|nr:hypothetical protein BC938DRAFT_479191 [Jimgerdemannia flammicorona]
MKSLTAINLEFYRSVSIPSKISSPRSFRIEPIETSSLNQDKSWTFCATSSDEAKDWIRVIHMRLGRRNIVDVVLDRLALGDSCGPFSSSTSTSSLRSRGSSDSFSSMTSDSNNSSIGTITRCGSITSTDPRCDSLFVDEEECCKDHDDFDDGPEILVVWEEVDVAHIERRTAFKRYDINLFEI